MDRIARQAEQDPFYQAMIETQRHAPEAYYLPMPSWRRCMR